MPKREHVQAPKQAKRSEETPEPSSKKMDMHAVLADIDVALEGIDQAFAENYIQKGGE